MEVESLPECCKQTLKDIERILNSAKCLAILLSISEDLAKPRPGGIASAMSALWFIAKTGYDAAHYRKVLNGSLQAIVRNRVQTVIELHILDHDTDAAIRAYWERMEEAFVSKRL